MPGWPEHGVTTRCARRSWRDRRDLLNTLATIAGDRAALHFLEFFAAPATFTPEVICRIIAMACEDPEMLDVPISHWSQSELAR